MLPPRSQITPSPGEWNATSRPAARYTPDLTRELTDGDGIHWTVREIVPELRPTKHRTLLTRPGYENGWLSFRSDLMACRIAPFPPGWRHISDYELERWCMKAQDRARSRRPGGHGVRR